MRINSFHYARASVGNRYLLDTNVVSELRESARRHADVEDWILAQPPASLFVSAVTILELEQGVALKERKDKRQGARLRQWMERVVLTRFAGRVLSVDQAVATRCAHLHVPNQRAERDAMIAATALTHGMTVVTRNVADFESTGVAFFNPWD